MTITEALTAEHAVFHSLFDHVEKAAPRLKTLAEARVTARLLVAVLDAHSKTEDDLFIEPLDHCLEHLGQHKTFHDEHEEIDRALRGVEEARTVKAARQNLLKAVLICRRHFDKEERLVFPMAEKVLKKKSLLELGKAWGQRRETHHH
jgi:hemerythrin-like domain-containing protein